MAIPKSSQATAVGMSRVVAATAKAIKESIPSRYTTDPDNMSASERLYEYKRRDMAEKIATEIEKVYHNFKRTKFLEKCAVPEDDGHC